jgi:hypothetical protein
MLVKLTPVFNFINILHKTFTHADPKVVKIKSSCQYLFCDFGIWAHKSCSYNVGEIDTWPLKGGATAVTEGL